MEDRGNEGLGVRPGMIPASDLVSVSPDFLLRKPPPPSSGGGRKFLAELAERSSFGTLDAVIAECVRLRDSTFSAGASAWSPEDPVVPFYEEPSPHWMVILDCLLWNYVLLPSDSAEQDVSVLGAPGGRAGLRFPGAARVITGVRGSEIPPSLAGYLPAHVRSAQAGTGPEAGVGEAVQAGDPFHRARSFYCDPYTPGFALFLFEYLTWGGEGERGCAPLSAEELRSAALFAEALLSFPEGGSAPRGSMVGSGTPHPPERVWPFLADLVTEPAGPAGPG